MIKTKCLIGVIPFLLKISLSFGQANVPADSLAYKKDSSYYKGVSDAKIFYSRYSKPAGATLITTIVTGPLGLVPALACSETPPKMHNLDFPEPELMRNTNYQVGYSQAALGIKKHKVWKNFKIGIFIFAVPAFVLLNGLRTSKY